MKHYISFTRTDISNSSADEIVQWLGINELLAVLSRLPAEKEFAILLDFLTEYAGWLELSQRRMEETLLEQSAICYMACAEAVKKIKARLLELYKGCGRC